MRSTCGSSSGGIGAGFVGAGRLRAAAERGPEVEAARPAPAAQHLDRDDHDQHDDAGAAAEPGDPAGDRRTPEPPPDGPGDAPRMSITSRPLRPFLRCHFTESK